MPDDPSQTDSWAEFRRQMPASRKWAYLDHASVAPISLPAQQAIATWSQQAAEQGGMQWSQWSRRLEQLRTTAADLIAADPAEIALVRNTTEGIHLVAEGYPWKRGDNIVTLADEFPSNLYPWLNLAARGVETRRVSTDLGRLDLGRLDDACDERTRIVSMSWINYATGYRHDVTAAAEIAHRHGALLLLDAIQGLGAFPLDVEATKIDFLAADGHKWLLGPEGAGLMYVRRDHLERLRPLGVGWNSVVHAHDFGNPDLVLKPSAARYEGGSPNMPGLHGLAASLDLLSGLGIARIAARILEITDFACQRLEALGAKLASHRDGDHRSGIVAFEVPGADSRELRRQCLASGVALSYRDGRLRISPHAYNNDADIERLIDTLRTATA